MAPWAPEPGPFLGGSYNDAALARTTSSLGPGGTYDDAALARTTFTPWGSSPA